MNQQERVALAFVKIMVAAPVDTQFVRCKRVQRLPIRRHWYRAEKWRRAQGLQPLGLKGCCNGANNGGFRAQIGSTAGVQMKC